MKRHNKLLAATSTIILASAGVACADDAAKTTTTTSIELSTDADKESYAMGYIFGTNMAQQVTVSKPDAFLKGMETVLKDGKAVMTQAEMSAAITAMQQRQQAEKQAKIAANKAKGEKFLAENKKRAGVTTTASGLQYEIITAAEGPKPKATDKVEVHYRGTLLDGTEFDSSYKRNSTAKFPLNRVIGGWTEGLQLMSPGAKYKFYIPSELAYGPRGSGANIGPNEALIFDVELVAINPK